MCKAYLHGSGKKEKGKKVELCCSGVGPRRILRSRDDFVDGLGFDTPTAVAD